MENVALPSSEQAPEPENQELEHVSAMDEEDTEESLAETMVCDSGSRLVPKGFAKPNCTEQIMLFVNAGAKEGSVELDPSIKLLPDNYFQGGDTFQTEEHINEGGDYPFIYRTARLGNFSYFINSLSPGDYHVDLHFVEIINVCGPKGMRVFNVFMQDEKVLSDFDIFSVVGANTPLQLVDAKVSIKEEEPLVIRFEGVIGSPVLSGICVRKAFDSGPRLRREYLTCVNCCSEIEVPSAQKKVMRTKTTAKYEKKIKELTDSLQSKTEECYQSWMSWKSANDQLEKVRMELDNKTFQTYSLDQTIEKQAEELNNISSRYDRKRKFWVAAISELDSKVQRMKAEQIKLSRDAHECVDGIPQLNKMVFAVQSLVEQCEDLKVKYNDEQVKRRKLFNQVQEAKGNIRVFCRCRPLSKVETLAGCSTVVDFEAARDGDLGVLNGSSRKTFKFDRVYTPKDDQVDVFADASPMVTSVLDGYNVCIFAYGQTGTGKTFTMEGTAEKRGVNYRTLQELFNIAKERNETMKYNISVSVLEVYNEQIRDLLDTSSTSKKLEIKQSSEGFHHIPGLVESEVENINQVWNVLQVGSGARSVGSNNINEHSSRSHCMLCVTVKAENLVDGETTKSKLWLVDLAGSERLAKTDVQGDRLKEAQNINRSLSALGDVISSLANKSSHIPYRNSKLTHLLQDSLGGDAKTLMFVQISPSDKDLSETLSSLNFATRVRGVELGPLRKQIDSSEVQRLKSLLDKAKQESKTKDESIRKLDESLQNLDGKARGKDTTMKNQQEKIRELESQLESKSLSHLQSEKQVSQLSEKLKGREETCVNLQEKVMELEKKLKDQAQFHSASYEKKVIDLEMKMKEQLEEFASHSSILQQKAVELEDKLLKEQRENSDLPLLRQKVRELEEQIREKEQQLICTTVAESAVNSTKPTPLEEELETRLMKEQQQNAEVASLHEKVKELEEKIKEQEKQLSFSAAADSAVKSAKSTPHEGKNPIRDEPVNESERRVLRSSSVFNRQLMQGPASAKDESHQNVRRKRLSRNGETENNPVSTAAMTSDRRSRKSDPPRPPSRITRATSKPVIPAQRPAIHAKTGREMVHKEKENKKRMWS